MRQIEQALLPENLKVLIVSGANYVDIPLSHLVAETIPRGAAEDFVFCELKMQETDVSFVFRAPVLMRIGEAAEYLVNHTLPHLRYRDYEWTLKHKRREVPPDHTFKSAGIRTGDTVHLIGNARMPRLLPRGNSRILIYQNYIIFQRFLRHRLTQI